MTSAKFNEPINGTSNGNKFLSTQINLGGKTNERRNRISKNV
jgi:hypothetical protein